MNIEKTKREVKKMKYRIYVNDKFIGYGHAEDVMIAQLENPDKTVSAEKC